MKWDDGTDSRPDRRERCRDDGSRPGRLVAWGDEQEQEQAGPCTLRVTNRDLATYMLAIGGTLLAMEHQAFGPGFAYIMDDADGAASEAFRRWKGQGAAPVVDVRDYAGAAGLVRRLLRDGMVPGESVQYTKEGGIRDEHGRCSA